MLGGGAFYGSSIRAEEGEGCVVESIFVTGYPRGVYIVKMIRI